MSDTTIPKEVLAVIALAIYEDQHQHDPESNILTIKRVQQEYLPWADKNRAMLQLPTKK